MNFSKHDCITRAKHSVRAGRAGSGLGKGSCFGESSVFGESSGTKNTKRLVGDLF